MRHTTGSVYAIFDKPVHMYRGTTMAGHHPGRGATRYVARLRRRLRAGDAVARPALHGGLPRARAPGAADFASAMDDYDNMAGMWIVGEDMPQEKNGVTLHAGDEGSTSACRSRTSHFDDHANDIAMRDHAYGRGSAIYEAVGATRIFHTPPYPSTHNLGTNRMSEKPRGRRRQQMGPDARHQEPLRLRRQPVHDRRGGKPDADHRRAGAAAGGSYRFGNEQRRVVDRAASCRSRGSYRARSAPGRASLR